MNENPEPPLLSVIMIVKNEESNLRRCLPTLLDVCGEICIMDTGSTDRTIEVAESFGAKTSRMEWTGDESDARNASVRMATGKWVFVVDADEAISPELASEIKSKLPQIDQKNFQSASVVWRNHYAGGSTSLTRIVRLGRNRGLHFQGSIHPTANYGTPNYELEGCLEHYGYQWTPEQRTKKSSHMLAHLRPYITGEKPDLARLSQYITYLLVSANISEFKSCLDKILTLYTRKERLGEPYWRQAVPNILQFLSDKDDFETGNFIATEIFGNHPDSAGAIFYLLQSAVKKADWPSVKTLSAQMLGQLRKPVGTLNIVYPAMQKPTAQAWQWLAESSLSPESKPQIPDSLLTEQNLHIILSSLEKNRAISTSSAPLASLLKIYAALSSSETLTEWSIASLQKNLLLRKTQTAHTSSEQLLLMILFIEFYSITGNMSQGILMAKETLETYSHLRWIAVLFDRSGKDWRLSKHIPGIKHLT